MSVRDQIKRILAVLLFFVMVTTLLSVTKPSSIIAEAETVQSISLNKTYTIKGKKGQWCHYRFDMIGFKPSYAISSHFNTFKLWIEGINDVNSDFKIDPAPDGYGYAFGYPLIQVASDQEYFTFDIKPNSDTCTFRLVFRPRILDIEITGAPSSVKESYVRDRTSPSFKGINFKVNYEDGTTRNYIYSGSPMHWNDDGYSYDVLFEEGNVFVRALFGGDNGGYISPKYDINHLPQIKTPVTNIALTGLSKKIAAGKKIQLTANVLPANAYNKTVTWTSSNPKVATVTQTGTVTIKKKTGGKSVIITATAKDGSGVKATYKITSMKGIVKKVAISGKAKVKAGKSLKLKAKVKASKGANMKIVWSSSNTKYATVSSSGKVKTTKAGKGKSVKITAKATDGSGKKATKKIKITK